MFAYWQNIESSCISSYRQGNDPIKHSCEEICKGHVLYNDDDPKWSHNHLPVKYMAQMFNTRNICIHSLEVCAFNSLGPSGAYMRQ